MDAFLNLGLRLVLPPNGWWRSFVSSVVRRNVSGQYSKSLTV
ncbi:hypothetical protein AcetOrient_orf00838 [Acetobacter orientalis]|uniref:Uncharacterized protein n=1 Tax=Acetobacter orientalis TaxID=146474 RepID=A0A2Z5ZEK5_9PROT|nr:hypothetical protein AcetOrient_orf00838 [Acetobacter orientalis]